MKIPNPSSTSTDALVTHADVLSTDPDLRAIELAFLHRLVSVTQHLNAQMLPKADTSYEASVSAALTRMQSEAFRVIAQELEKDLPIREGFGPFRGGHDKEAAE